MGLYGMDGFYGMDGLMGAPGFPVCDQGCPSTGNGALVTPGVSISNTCLALMSLLRGAFMLSGALRLNTLRVVGNVAEWCQAD